MLTTFLLKHILSELNIKNFVTEFDYVNENNTSDKNSYLSNKTTYSLGEFNNFEFSTRKNKTKDFVFNDAANTVPKMTPVMT